MEKDNDNQEIEEIIEEIGENNNSEGNNIEDVPDMFSPFDEPIHERSYTKQEQVSVGEIEEPDFNKQTTDEKLDEIKDDEKKRDSVDFIETKEEPVKEEPVKSQEKIEEKSFKEKLRNPDIDELTPKEKEAKAEQLVDLISGALPLISQSVASFIKIDNDEVEEIVEEGVDPQAEIPIGNTGVTTNLIEFVNDFNESAEEACTIPDDYIQKVRPALIRICKKNGWGLSDEHFVIAETVKMVGVMAMNIFMVKKTKTEFINGIKKAAKMSQQKPPEPVYKPESITKPPTPPTGYKPRPIVQEEEEEITTLPALKSA